MRAPSENSSKIPENSVFTQIQKIANKYGMIVTFVIASTGLYQWTTANNKAEQALSQSAQNTQTSANLIEATANIAGAVSVIADNKSWSSDVKKARKWLKDVQEKLKK